MGAPQEIVQEIFTVIEGGRTIGTSAEIIQFPADNGSNAFNVVQKTLVGSNGTGINYWVAAVAEGASALSAGALFITCTFPEFIALAVPCLGIAVGTIWYNMAPEFWTNVALKLSDAGYTFKNKVVAFMNTEGNLVFPENALKILADDLINAGVFELGQNILPEEEQNELFYPNQYERVNLQNGLATELKWITHNYYGQYELELSFIDRTGSRPLSTGMLISDGNTPGSDSPYFVRPVAYSRAPFTVTYKLGSSTSTLTSSEVTRGDATYYVAIPGGAWGADYLPSFSSSAYVDNTVVDSHTVWDVGYIMENGIREKGKEDLLQKGATFPSLDVSWRDLFPDWIPWEFPLIPISGGDPYRLPGGLPVEYPGNLPIEQPYQKEAQDPQDNEEENPEVVIETIDDPERDPWSEEGDEDEDEERDEDEPADDNEIAGTLEPGINPNPIDPLPEYPITPVIPIPPTPASVSSNKMFTVYNPTSSQLDQLGGYLWDGSLIETLRKIWQDPIDGIIGLSQVYCTPNTGTPHNIILGYLDSGVSSKVVSNQFSHIDCGSVTVPEFNQNATDYNPYTAMQLFLPFIGITEIDIDEFMGGTISIKYHIDVYTGTCLAEVKMTRSRDVPSGGVVYTFTGNCSQQLPLTSGDQKGLLSALIGAAGVGIGIASGGAVSAAGLALHEAGRDVTREMMHVSHSGNLSANAGIMGQKKPYIIISRRIAYNANSYGKFYGYPINKTVFLSNFSGFCKVKAARLRSKATEAEKAEILELCKEGIIM